MPRDWLLRRNSHLRRRQGVYSFGDLQEQRDNRRRGPGKQFRTGRP